MLHKFASVLYKYALTEQDPYYKTNLRTAVMTPKQERLDKLRNLITSNKISNQEGLLAMLAEEGVCVTQATLSRDLKELKVAKTPDGAGGYNYRLPYSQHTFNASNAGGTAHFSSGVRSIEFSGQMCVLKTIPGYANMVASILDAALGRGIMGSIAGDDTLLIIVREGTDYKALLSEMEAVIPGISSRRI